MYVFLNNVVDMIFFNRMLFFHKIIITRLFYKNILFKTRTIIVYRSEYLIFRGGEGSFPRKSKGSFWII